MAGRRATARRHFSLTTIRRGSWDAKRQGVSGEASDSLPPRLARRRAYRSRAFVDAQAGTQQWLVRRSASSPLRRRKQSRRHSFARFTRTPSWTGRPRRGQFSRSRVRSPPVCESHLPPSGSLRGHWPPPGQPAPCSGTRLAHPLGRSKCFAPRPQYAPARVSVPSRR
jgi:hypothetical protein